MVNQTNLAQSSIIKPASLNTGKLPASNISTSISRQEIINNKAGRGAAKVNEVNPSVPLSVNNDTNSVGSNETFRGYRVVGTYCYDNGTCGKICLHAAKLFACAAA